MRVINEMKVSGKPSLNTAFFRPNSPINLVFVSIFAVKPQVCGRTCGQVLRGGIGEKVIIFPSEYEQRPDSHVHPVELLGICSEVVYGDVDRESDRGVLGFVDCWPRKKRARKRATKWPASVPPLTSATPSVEKRPRNRNWYRPVSNGGIRTSGCVTD